jgi:hypothetical protein
MMNWLYTWYNPRIDGTAEVLASQMGDTFLRGVCGARRYASKKKPVAVN